MTVESVTYISDLNASYPAGGDAPSEGDNHIRNIKTGLLGSFPNFVGAAVTATEAELNILDGVTATATELNYADGPNTANKFCLLDASADVPLAQIPDTLTGKDAQLHNGLYVQTGTTTLASTANGANSATTDIALTSITTVTAIIVGVYNTTGVCVTARGADGYLYFGGDLAFPTPGGTPTTPSAGNIRLGFYNGTGGTTALNVKYTIYGT